MMQEFHFEDTGDHPPSSMESTIYKLRLHLDSITTFLNPLLPLANCHMVEFFTQNHWDLLIPTGLRDSMSSWDFKTTVEKFWNIAEDMNNKDNTKLGNWINKARSHCITVNNDYCITAEQLQDRIKNLGGEVKPEIKVKQFMSGKKSYEVQTMSRLVASLYGASSATCCVEAGGGRGHLPVALTLGYGVPSLTIDCDVRTLRAATQRIKIIQKQWHAIAKRVKDGHEERISESIDKNLHRFASAFVTRDTDLKTLVNEKFPEFTSSETKLLLTGLHTCGNLGPDSLRIFTSQGSISAVFNVPCCYHLLTEHVDAGLFDVFQRDYAPEHDTGQGFPMSEHLRNYNLGRNARMLAAQSIDRVVYQRQLPSKSLLYRALLEVLIKKHLPDVFIADGKLKRITPNKYNDFREYFKMADSILKLKLYDILPECHLSDIEKNLDSQWEKIVLFYLLRLCLAQVIESVILLDRLLYLYENGFKNVFLVKLFDPILSPRCHSIVAMR
ncbi:LOW QUALITY PROTEIN: probable methyltransferase-like protein 25 [Galleria mellonella]|uniref:LOW QUALITY PROTEIN: probable methyltransferase-like protein 25 n=1 Tax=Galleria mellonella TaxID=7137 RepID=A0A6J1WMZ9_GALME|nr:LOW QUALITY PROTEIN: probable methyltransferase-like protein 25 [Galleria mellonella]